MPAETPFDRIPREMTFRAFGVDYCHLRPPEGGDFYLTRYGWPLLPHLSPSNWFSDQWYARKGVKLEGATGSVFRVATKPAGGRSVELVVKFSRMAQDVPLYVATNIPEKIPPEVLASARFNSPMEEFGLVMDLRRGGANSASARFLAQRPLGIYAPPEKYALWQLGRSECCFDTHMRILSKEQEAEGKAIDMDISRLYIMLYGWIKGQDAQEAHEAGLLGREEFESMAPEVIRRLRKSGFRILDNKPKHYIVRADRRRGGLLRRGSRLVYGLVDFELLQRTAEYQEMDRARRRERYWRILRMPSPAVAELPDGLKSMTVFGVDYLYGALPDGGRAWTVGRNPELYEYFLTSRWHRTPRVRLSLRNEVYYTRTRDGIDIVYNRSRVGSRPREDPIDQRGRRIREHGYNSPFENVAIAQALRREGIPTAFPLAICRTGHTSIASPWLRDDRRYATHAALRTQEPEAEPILSPRFEYHTLWVCFSGTQLQACGPADGPRCMDFERARESGLLGAEEFEKLRAALDERLEALGLQRERIGTHELMVCTGAEPRVSVCLDALTAHECGLLGARDYRDLIECFDRRLRALGCEKLDLSGNDLLLLVGLDGRFEQDPQGGPAATLCSFDLVRGYERLIGRDGPLPRP